MPPDQNVNESNSPAWHIEEVCVKEIHNYKQETLKAYLIRSRFWISCKAVKVIWSHGLRRKKQVLVTKTQGFDKTKPPEELAAKARSYHSFFLIGCQPTDYWLFIGTWSISSALPKTQGSKCYNPVSGKLTNLSSQQKR